MNRLGYISSTQCYIAHISCQLCFIGKDLQKAWKSSKWTELFLIFKIPEKKKLYPGKEYDVLPEAEWRSLTLLPQPPQLHQVVNNPRTDQKNQQQNLVYLLAVFHSPFSSHRHGPCTSQRKCGPLMMDTLWSAAARLRLEIGSASLACGFLLTGNLPGLVLTPLMTNPNRCYFPVKLFIPFVIRRQLWSLIIYLLLLPPWVPLLPSWYSDACCEVGVLILNLDAVSLQVCLPVDTGKVLSFPSPSIPHAERDIFQQWLNLSKISMSLFFPF